MTAPLARRLRFKRPRTREAFSRVVAELLKATPDGHAEIIGPDGARVRVAVRDVVKHFWDDHPERWSNVSLIRPAIQRALRIHASRRDRSTRLYVVRLRLDPKRGSTTPFVTAAHGAGTLRHWRTLFEVGGRLDIYLKRQAGEPVWVARSASGRGNPAPALVVSGASRPGRAPVTHSKFSRVRRAPSGCGSTLLAQPDAAVPGWPRRWPVAWVLPWEYR